ncbi:MAG: prepilin-type N-terminal cleavage/methylation domain-containing protein [Acidobacteriota bacterium]
MKSRNTRKLTATQAPAGGFSLLEVLIAIAVLSFGILGMAQLFMLAISNNRRAALQAESSALLAHRLEQYREVDFCKLWTRANIDNGTWQPDSLQFVGENTGQNAGTDGKVMQDRSDPRIGGSAANIDWIVERRLICRNQGLTSIKDGSGNPQTIPNGEDVILIELRGMKSAKTFRGQGTNAGKKIWTMMSTYRTKRNTQVVCP